jgi:hypothetical protein
MALPRMPSTSRCVSLLLMLLLDVASGALRGAGPRPEVGRRGAMAAAASALIAAAPLSASASATSTPPPREDPYTHTSFFGLSPPPLSGQWSRDQLVAEARSGGLRSMQIAPQHDCVFAITTAGRRYSCLVRDQDFPSLLLDSMGTDGSYAFEVLPMDPNRAAVRSFAGRVLKLSLAVAAADLLGLVPWDTTPYGSVAERDQAAGQPRPQRSEAVRAAMQRLVRFVRPGIDRSAPAALAPDSAEALRDDALRLVFGMASEEETVLIKQRLKRKAQQIKHDYEPEWVTPLTADGFQQGKLPTLEQVQRALQTVRNSSPRLGRLLHMPTFLLPPPPVLGPAWFLRLPTAT